MKRKSFTLIEILGVMAIIAILATLGFAGYSYANNKAKETATEGLIARLNAAFEMAQQKSGFTPPAKDFTVIVIDTDNQKITVNDGSSDKSYPGSETGREKKMYTEFYKTFVKTLEMDTMSRFLENGKVIDAWGNPIYFCYPGKLKKGGFDLISAGSNGTFGNSEKETPSSTSIDDYRSEGEWICDDIANF